MGSYDVRNGALIWRIAVDNCVLAGLIEARVIHISTFFKVVVAHNPPMCHGKEMNDIPTHGIQSFSPVSQLTLASARNGEVAPSDFMPRASSGFDSFSDFAFSALQVIALQTKRWCEQAISDSYGTSRRLAFSHITALMLQNVELPRFHGLSQDELHASVSSRTARYRRNGVHLHLWARNHDTVAFDDSPVECVPPIVAWMQLAERLPLIELIVLANTMLHGDPRLRVCELGDFASYLTDAGRFRGKAKCRLALHFVASGTRSSWESRLYLALMQHGLPMPELNYVVADAEGADMVVDAAYPECKVAIEYQGDYHRLSKAQYRSDQRKRRRLQSLGWIVIAVTVDDLRDEKAREELAASVVKAMGIPLPQSVDKRCLALMDGWE